MIKPMGRTKSGLEQRIEALNDMLKKLEIDRILGKFNKPTVFNFGTDKTSNDYFYVNADAYVIKDGVISKPIIYSPNYEDNMILYDMFINISESKGTHHGFMVDYFIRMSYDFAIGNELISYCYEVNPKKGIKRNEFAYINGCEVSLYMQDKKVKITYF